MSRPSQLTTTIKSHGLPTRDTHVLVASNGQEGQQQEEGRWKTGGHGPAAMEFGQFGHTGDALLYRDSFI